MSWTSTSCRHRRVFTRRDFIRNVGLRTFSLQPTWRSGALQSPMLSFAHDVRSPTSMLAVARRDVNAFIANLRLELRRTDRMKKRRISFLAARLKNLCVAADYDGKCARNDLRPNALMSSQIGEGSIRCLRLTGRRFGLAIGREASRERSN